MLIYASLSCSGYNARQCTHYTIIADRGLGSVMVGKDKREFYASRHGTAITFLLIGIFTTSIITTSILSVSTLVLNQDHTAMAQQQLQANQTFSPSVEEQQQLLEGKSFQIDNMTFSHNTAS